MFLFFTGCSEKELLPKPSAEEKQDINVGENLSSYTVTRTTAPISIDGKLDEEDWEKAVEALMKNSVTWENTPLKTTVKFLWDDNYLYAGFHCEDIDAWATLTDEDDPLWNEEVVELFIDPDCDGHTYYEYEINPINVKVDLFVINSGKRLNGKYTIWKDWDFTNIKSEVYVEGDGKNASTVDKFWIVEIAIPFEDLWEMPHVPPRDGDMWRINAYRIERGNPEDKNDHWGASFSPVLRNSFHTPWQFGNLYFKE